MKKLSILLVEDNEADIMLTSEILSQTGIDKVIHVARDGAEALDYICKRNQYTNAQTPDLIVLDINLPKLNGKEVLCFIKENDNYKSIPVIMYTSSNSETDILYCSEKRADLYLIKANALGDFLKIKTAIKEFIDNHLT